MVQFPSDCRDAATIEALLNQYGEVPLPPYIDRHDPADADRYQTRYAERPGAVAAPTAGLHFSDELLAALQRKGVRLARITLHVGLGTFRPLENEDLTNLDLHSEWVEVTAEVVEAIRACRGRVIAVGTTSVRALEGAAQAHGGELRSFCGSVNLVIKPGYRFRVVKGLLTNFHLPKSSLLLLVQCLDWSANTFEALSGGHRAALSLFLLRRCYVDRSRVRASERSILAVERLKPGDREWIDV